MNNSNPLISVIVRSYNQKKSILSESLLSLLNQTYNNIEVIVADDSENAETIKCINEIASIDKRVIILRKPYRMGFSNSFNVAFELCKGEYIALLDDDDVSYPKRFEIQLNYAKTHPEVDVMGGDVDIIDENDTIISERRYPTSPSAIKRMFIFRSPFCHPTLMFKRRLIDEGYRYNPEFKRAEDVDLLFRLYGNGYKFGNTGKKILKYRVVGNLQNKRQKDQWYYNHRARTENFIWSMPFFSIASWLVSFAYQYIPSFLIKKMYARENKKFLKKTL